MSHGFSSDLRFRVVLAIEDDLSTRKAAARFGIGISTAGEWYRRYLDNGEVTSRKRGQPPGSKLDKHERFILGLVRKTPDIALYEIADCLLLEFGLSTCAATVWHFFNKRGLTHKKRLRMQVNRNEKM